MKNLKQQNKDQTALVIVIRHIYVIDVRGCSRYRQLIVVITIKWLLCFGRYCWYIILKFIDSWSQGPKLTIVFVFGSKLDQYLDQINQLESTNKGMATVQRLVEQVRPVTFMSKFPMPRYFPHGIRYNKLMNFRNRPRYQMSYCE